MVFGDVQGGEALMDVNFLSERREAAARNPMAKSVRKLKVPAIEKYQQLAGLKAIIGLYIYIPSDALTPRLCAHFGDFRSGSGRKIAKQKQKPRSSRQDLVMTSIFVHRVGEPSALPGGGPIVSRGLRGQEWHSAWHSEFEHLSVPRATRKTRRPYEDHTSQWIFFFARSRVAWLDVLGLQVYGPMVEFSLS